MDLRFCKSLFESQLFSSPEIFPLEISKKKKKKKKKSLRNIFFFEFYFIFYLFTLHLSIAPFWSHSHIILLSPPLLLWVGGASLGIPPDFWS
jgi:hypothetical protein